MYEFVFYMYICTFCIFVFNMNITDENSRLKRIIDLDNSYYRTTKFLEELPIHCKYSMCV